VKSQSWWNLAAGLDSLQIAIGGTVVLSAGDLSCEVGYLHKCQTDGPAGSRFRFLQVNEY
jgi:hypothetical protein